MNKRSIGSAIIFTLITCGLYGIYWMIKMTDEMHTLIGRKNTASGAMLIVLSLVTCGLYAIYWTYKMGEAVAEAKSMRGLHTDSNTAILYLVLMIFGLGLVTYALLQSAINDLIDYDDDNAFVPNSAA